MTLHPDVLREIETTTTPKRRGTVAPAASRQSALEVKVARLEAALSSCVQWKDLPIFLATAFKEVGITTTAARLDKLEARPELKYLGVWSAGKTYAENSLVTHAGSLWIAKQKTASFPGGQAEPGAWQLCTKRGRDGKDYGALSK
jgi:hypothetical protein